MSKKKRADILIKLFDSKEDKGKTEKQKKERKSKKAAKLRESMKGKKMVRRKDGKVIIENTVNEEAPPKKEEKRGR